MAGIRTFGASLGALVIGIASPAAAQEQSDNAAAQFSKDIIVTAQKREERLIDVPISLAALGAEQLEQQQISELRDFVGQVPNLVINNFNARSDTVRLFIRGVGQNDVTMTQDPSVALYADGIYVGTTIGGGFETEDLERIEVLRGPQGTLYGRNATGGAINLISNKPDPDKLMVKGSATYGNYDLLRGNITANVPLTNTLAVRGTLVRTKRDGLYKNTGEGHDFAEQDRFAARGAVRWQPTDSITLDYAFDYSRTQDTGTLTLPVEGAPASLPISAPFDVPGTFGLVQAINTIDTEFSVPGPFQDKRLKSVESLRPLEKGDGKVYGHTVTAQYDVSDAFTLRGIYGHRKINNYQASDNLPVAKTFIRTRVVASAIPNLPVGMLLNQIGPNAAAQNLETTKFDSDSFELQGLGTIPLGAGSLDYVVGGYYYKDKGFQRGVASPVGAGPLVFASLTTIKNKTVAGFGQFTARPFEDERLSLTLGMRYSEDDRAATRVNESSFSFAALGGFTPTNCAFFGPQGYFPPGTTCDPSGEVQAATYDHSFNNFSIALTAAYKVNDDFNVYARYAQGYKSGGTSQRSSNPINFATGFKPENVDSYEIGMKGNLFDRRLLTSIAAFYMTLDHFQTSVQTGATAGDRDFIGIDGNDIYGIEFDVTGVVSNSLRIGLNGAWLETKIGEKSASVLLDTGVTSVQYFINEQAYAPNLSGSLWADFRQPVSDDWTFGAYSIVSYQGSADTSQNVLDNRKLRARAIVDANMSMTRALASGGELGVRLWAKNLFDKVYDTVRFGSFAFSGASTVTEYGEPRTYGATAFFKF